MAAWATGREMEGIAFAVRFFPFMAAFAFVAAVVAVYLLSPKSCQGCRCHPAAARACVP
jgi:hypothetical protein